MTDDASCSNAPIQTHEWDRERARKSLQRVEAAGEPLLSKATAYCAHGTVRLVVRIPGGGETKAVSAHRARTGSSMRMYMTECLGETSDHGGCKEQFRPASSANYCCSHQKTAGSNHRCRAHPLRTKVSNSAELDEQWPKPRSKCPRGKASYLESAHPSRDWAGGE